MPTEMDLTQSVMSLVEREIARRCKKVKEDYTKLERRAAKLERQCNKMRAKLRRLKRRSVGITKPARIQGKRIGSKSRLQGEEKSTTGLQEEEEDKGITGLQQQEEERPTKTKFVRLSQRATDFIMARSVPPRPQIPSHMLSTMAESSQELYRRFVASSEKIDRIYERMRAQGHRLGYIEVEVADDDAEE